MGNLCQLTEGHRLDKYSNRMDEEEIYGWAIDQCGQVSVNNCAVVERLEIITRWFSDLTMESGEEDSIGSS